MPNKPCQSLRVVGGEHYCVHAIAPYQKCVATIHCSWYTEAEEMSKDCICIHQYGKLGGPRLWCNLDDKGCYHSHRTPCTEFSEAARPICAQSVESTVAGERVCLEDVGETCVPDLCTKFEPCEVESECINQNKENDKGVCSRVYSNPPVLCSVLHGNCIHWNYKHVGDTCPINQQWLFKNTRAIDYHRFALEHDVEKATFLYPDGEAVDYVKISDREFQLNRVGDCACNYTVP